MAFVAFDYMTYGYIPNMYIAISTCRSNAHAFRIPRYSLYNIGMTMKGVKKAFNWIPDMQRLIVTRRSNKSLIRRPGNRSNPIGMTFVRIRTWIRKFYFKLTNLDSFILTRR